MSIETRSSGKSHSSVFAGDAPGFVCKHVLNICTSPAAARELENRLDFPLRRDARTHHARTHARMVAGDAPVLAIKHVLNICTYPAATREPENQLEMRWGSYLNMY